MVAQVYDGVVLPAMERAVASAFGFLAPPLLWAYRRTIGLAVRYVVRSVARKQTTGEDERQSVEDAKSALAAFSSYSETIRAYTSSAANLVGGIGGKIRFYAMLPLYVVFIVALLLAVAPIIVVLCLTAGGTGQ